MAELQVIDNNRKDRSASQNEMKTSIDEFFLEARATQFV